jgi:hypothetical protein
MGEIPGWMILVGAVLVGYFVIGKVIDFFKTGSALGDAPEVPKEFAGNWKDDEKP